ncbi:MAG: organic solvent ABC transporter ATP-binding protein [Verrucomicrobia bacterium]|nr:organic solvent ABC transporter ATP-binding protein [Verrucomicrobiota bacterium]
MTEGAVLTLESVTVTAGAAYEYGLAEVSFSLAAGECILIRLESGMHNWALGDLAQGLAAPEAGRVLFEGRDWLSLSPDEAAAARARIGRVYERSLWISNLDVDENIRLGSRHHTNRPEEEIEAEAIRLARMFGLEDLPRARPARVRSRDLRTADWIRALLGERALLLLERPMREAYAERGALLATAARAAREKGAAVIWLQGPGDPDILKTLEPDRVYAVAGERLSPVERM